MNPDSERNSLTKRKPPPASYLRGRLAIQRQLNMRKEYDFIRGKRGAVIPSAGKTRITIMLDDDVIQAFLPKWKQPVGDIRP